MTLFDQPTGLPPAAEDHDPVEAAPVKRPPRWAVGNWPVRWKVLAIALVPMVLAMVFGALRISSATTEAGQLRRTADRAELVPAITDYMAALGAALVASSSDADAEGAEDAQKDFDSHKQDLQSRLAAIDAASDVRSGVKTLIGGGQALLDKVTSHSIELRDLVTGYAPILLTAEDAINGSVRIDNVGIRAQTEGLSRAVGARGQMMMQQLLVNRGGELPEPMLRTSMITLAGTEPSTLFGMSEVLGVDTPEAKKLQQQLVTRLTIMSNPESPLAGNPELLNSIQATDKIASQVIAGTTSTVTRSVEDLAAERRTAAVRDTVLVLVALAVALAVVLLVARSLVAPLRTLRDGALKVAHTDLEDEIARVRAGDEREPSPLPVYTTEEVGQVAHAVDQLHAQALLLAGDEARLRLLVNDMFETMSRRNRSLVDQQLALIDRLERDEHDPDRLDSLFRLDHLAARMRRNGANLLVLAGAQTAQDKGRPVPLSTVVDAATSEVEDYQRVDTAMVPDVTLIGPAAGDVVHLFAELIDNALRYSPPESLVRVSAAATEDGGVGVQIIDTGLGMTDTDLRIANMRLVADSEVSPDNARHMGLFVVSRLAQRHGIWVRLTASAGGNGIIAEASLPPSLLVGAADDLPQRRQYPEPARPIPTRSEQAPTVAPLASLLPQRTPGRSGVTGVPVEPPPQQPVEQPPREQPSPVAAAAGDDLIYQRMLSEWLVDPHELARSADLDWKSVWDHGWTVAGEVENVAVVDHTEGGLPVRDPGARLVPGAADDTADTEVDEPYPVTSRHQARERDPDAIRASISSHFGGVRAGRSHAHRTNEGWDQQ